VVQFDLCNLDRNDFVILAGALDYRNEEFRIFKVSTNDIQFLVQQGRLDLIHVYIDLETYEYFSNTERFLLVSPLN